MPEKAVRTVLAFDFGLKRIGVAVGEAELGTAHPLETIAAPGFPAIEKLVREWQPTTLVVGLPHAESGEHALAGGGFHRDPPGDCRGPGKRSAPTSR